MQSTRKILQSAALVVLVLLCASAGLHAQSDRRPQPVMAVDADGNEIGTVLKMDYSLQRMQVAVEIEGRLVPVLVGKDSFSHGARPMAYFASSNCTGPAYLTGNAEDSLGPPVGIAGPRGTVFRGYPDSMALREIGSVLGAEGCKEFPARIAAMDAEAVLDLADRFAPPFDIAPKQARDDDARRRGAE